jgi:hypothetical protein
MTTILISSAVNNGLIDRLNDKSESLITALQDILKDTMVQGAKVNIIKIYMMQFKGIIAVALLGIFCLTCNLAETDTVKNAKEQADMFETDGVPYPVKFANYQRNSLVEVETNATGRLLWSKNYADIDETLLLLPLGVHISGDFLGVRSTENLLIFKLGGEFIDDIAIGENKAVVFGREAMAYTRPSLLLDYRNYEGEVILESKGFPALRDFSVLHLLKPSRDDFLAAVHFTGGPEDLPQEYDLFRVPLDKSFPPWSFSGEGILDHVLLLPDGVSAVIIQGKTVTLFDTVEGKKTGSFEIGMNEIESACLDLEGDLVLVGSEPVGNTARPCLKVMTLSGEQKWTLQLGRPHTDQPPACGRDGRIHIIDGVMLKCIANGELLWEIALKSSDPSWLTVTADNRVVCLNGALLNLFDPEGERIFEILVTEENETFDAPVALDSGGRLYVAGGKSLYCFE